MSAPEGTEKVTWGGVLTGDVVVGPDGREWHVFSRTGGEFTLECGVERVTSTPPPTRVAHIRPRVQVPAREALETILDTFPDATVDAHLRDPLTCCDTCGARVWDALKHDAWHDALADRLADLDKEASQ